MYILYHKKCSFRAFFLSGVLRPHSLFIDASHSPSNFTVKPILPAVRSAYHRRYSKGPGGQPPGIDHARRHLVKGRPAASIHKRWATRSNQSLRQMASDAKITEILTTNEGDWWPEVRRFSIRSANCVGFREGSGQRRAGLVAGCETLVRPPALVTENKLDWRL